MIVSVCLSRIIQEESVLEFRESRTVRELLLVVFPSWTLLVISVSIPQRSYCTNTVTSELFVKVVLDWSILVLIVLEMRVQPLRLDLSTEQLCRQVRDQAERMGSELLLCWISKAVLNSSVPVTAMICSVKLVSVYIHDTSRQSRTTFSPSRLWSF